MRRIAAICGARHVWEFHGGPTAEADDCLHTG